MSVAIDPCLKTSWQELTKVFSHMWDGLARKVGKRLAENLLILLTLIFVMEVLCFTMVLTFVIIR
jgi:hypothetical protein